jgi:protein-disulfide isomerase
LSEDISVKKSTYNNLIKAIVTAIAIAAFAGGYSLATFSNDDSVTDDDLEKLIDAIKEQKAQPIQQVPTQQAAPQQQILQSISLDDDPVKGDHDAPVTIVEFSDFQCPFCLRFAKETLSQIEQNYVDIGKVRFVYRDLPLENIHANALAAHIAAECADDQNMFWPYHDTLFEKQAEWQRLPQTETSSKLVEYAVSLGLDSTKFESCVSDPSVADEVRKDSMDAAKYGATGTPTFFIGNERDGFVKLVGAQPFSAFQIVIDQQLN